MTINGKTKEQVLAELQHYFDGKEIKQRNGGSSGDSYNYYPGEEYIQGMDEIVGTLNYSFEVSEKEITNVLGVYNASVLGKMTLLDDDGNPVCSKTAAGCSDIIVVNDTGNPKNISNDIVSATTNAFKNCCKKFGLGVVKEKISKGTEFKLQFVEKLRTAASGKCIYGKAYIMQGDERTKLYPVILFKKGMESLTCVCDIDTFNSKCLNRTITVYGQLGKKKDSGEEQIVINEFSVK